MLILINISDYDYNRLFPGKPTVFRGQRLDDLFLMMRDAIGKGKLMDEEPGYYYPKEEPDVYN